MSHSARDREILAHHSSGSSDSCPSVEPAGTSWGSLLCCSWALSLMPSPFFWLCSPCVNAHLHLDTRLGRYLLGHFVRFLSTFSGRLRAQATSTAHFSALPGLEEETRVYKLENGLQCVPVDEAWRVKAMRLRKAARVILIGAPGVGKGTQSERLLQRFPQLSSISSGDLLRHHVNERTRLGIKVESIIKAGGLVPDELILDLLRNELHQRGWVDSDRNPRVMTLNSSAMDSGSKLSESDAGAAALQPSPSFLLDGFPRTAAQANRLDSIVPVNLAVSLNTPLDVIMERISGRWVHESSGRVYNKTFNPPMVAGVDDITGDPLVRRADDDEETYRKRFLKFQQTSEPLLEHYAKKGVLWEVEGLSSDDISPKLFEEFKRRFS